MKTNPDIFICPACHGKLDVSRKLKCRDCKRTFKKEGDVPLLFWPNNWNSKDDVTETVKSFYEENPFPNYDDIDSIWTLKQKAAKGIFVRLLNEQIPDDAHILEVGCGTGQLSNILGSSGKRKVLATDICLNSLKLGQEFKKKNKISGTSFFQMNLFRPIFKPESFDIIICNGVLHHTSDPFLGFKTISRLVKPGGYIIVGLYNKIGRIPTDIRRVFFSVFGKRLAGIDPVMKDKNIALNKRETWFADQYKNPHESKHSIGEVLGWFDKEGFKFINGIPKPSLSSYFSEKEKIFEKNPKGNFIDHLLVELGILLSGGKEGGFFVMIGRNERKARDS